MIRAQLLSACGHAFGTVSKSVGLKGAKQERFVEKKKSVAIIPPSPPPFILFFLDVFYNGTRPFLSVETETGLLVRGELGQLSSQVKHSLVHSPEYSIADT